jgi:hypothetical protein
MSPSARLVSIRREVKKLIVEAHRCWRELSESLREAGVHVLDYSELTKSSSGTRKRTSMTPRFRC